MANVNGQQYAMNVVTPMPRWTVPALWSVFNIAIANPTDPSGKIPWWSRLLNLIPARRNSTAGLVQLSFIHFARWTMIHPKDWPHVSHDQPKEQITDTYLLFNSNFNGSWDEYVDAFSDVLSGGLDLIWRWSRKYPMARPVTPFKNYIRHNQFETDHYYSAYPYASDHDVKGAMQTCVALQKLEANVGNMSDEAFDAAFHQMMLSVQNSLCQHSPVTDPTIGDSPVVPEKPKAKAKKTQKSGENA